MRFRHLTSAVAQILLNASGGAILQRGGNLLVSGYRDGARESGAVYLYNSALELQTTIISPEPNKLNYNFGAKIALGDNKIAVSNSDRFNTGGPVIHIYDLDGSNRIELQASDGASGEYFGWWLDISGDTLVVGAGENRKIYIYDLSASDIASTEIKIHKPNVIGFGHTVAVGHGKVVVGAFEHVTSYGSGEIEGAAYIYDIDGTNEIELIPAQNGHTLGYNTVNYGNGPRAQDRFGTQVGISADKIFVSARLAGNNNNGAVYTYNHDGSGESMIFAPTIQPGQETYFGMDFAVTDSKLVVGAPDLGGAGGPGSVWVMDHDGSNYVQITSSHTTQFLGRAVAVVADKVVASYENGDTAGNNRGQIHVFDMDGSNEVVVTSSGDNEDNDFWGNPVDGTSGSYPMKMFVSEGYKTYADDQKIYVMDIDGENLIELSAPEGLSQPSSSRYADNIEVSGTNLVAIDPHGNTAYVYDLTSTGEPTSFSLDSTISGSAADNFVLEGNRLIVNRNPFATPGRILVYNITNGNLDASFTNSDNAGFMRMDVGNDKIVATSGYGDTRKIYVYDIDDTTGSSEIIITPPAPSNTSQTCNVVVGNGKIAYADYDDDNTFYIYNLDGSNEVVVDVSSASLAGYSNFGQSGQWRVGDWTMAIGNERIVLGTNFTGVFIISDLDGSNLSGISMSNLGYSGDATAGFASNNEGQIYVVNSKIMIAATNGRTSGNESDGIVYTFDLDGSNPKQILSPRGTGSGYHFGKDIAANDPTGLAKFANLPAVISNISSVYTLTEGQDTVITGTAVDPEGDAVTWSFEEVATGDSYVIATAWNDDDNGSNSGSFYVYDANDMSAQPTKISGPNENAKFGGSAVQYANKLYVGSWTATNANKVYQYDLTNLSAAPVEILPPTSYTDGSFGKYVNIVDDKLAVSTSSGPYKVFLYDTNDLSAEPEVISNPSTDTGNYFGSSVTSNSTHIFIAAHADNGGGSYHGAVFAYDKNDLSAAPVELREIGRYGGSEQFGDTIAADDSHVLISRYGAQGAGGIYRYDASDLSASPTLVGHWDDPSRVNGEFDSFGSQSILITEDKVIVGARYAGSIQDGRVYVFDKTEFMSASSIPTPLATLSAQNTNQYYGFGKTISIVNSTLIVSSYGDDDNGANAGSFYTFDLNDLSAPGTEIHGYDTAAGDGFGWVVLGVSPASSLNDVTVTQSDNVFTITPGTTDSNFTLRFKVTDAAGNVTTKTSTFTYDYVNKAPIVSGIVSQYNLTQGQDTVITASATDPEGDAITWSFEEIKNNYLFVSSPDIKTAYVYEPSTMNLLYTFATSVQSYGMTPASMAVGGGKWAIGNGNRNTSTIHVYDLNDLSSAPVELTNSEDTGFGKSIALSSDKMYVGLYKANNRAGEVRAYDLNDLTASPTIITSPSPKTNDGYFGGDRVEVSGNKVFIGQTKTQDGNGAVWVYDNDDLSATPVEITAPGSHNFNGNGFAWEGAFATSETHLIVGMKYSGGSQTHAGYAFVYDINDLSAAPTTLSHPNRSNNDYFGEAVFISSKYAVVKQKNGNTSIENVYVFDMNDLSAAPTLLTQSTTNDRFGEEISILGDSIYISAKFDDDSGTNAGKFYIYDGTDLSAAPQEFTGNAAYNQFGSSTLTYEAPSALNGVTVTQSDNVFTITPGTADASFALRITATDSNGNATSVTSTFGLNYVNQAPVISGVNTAYTLTQGQDTVITASATDPEGDAITWSFEEVKSGASYIAVGAPLDDVHGTNTGTVYVYDASNLNAQPVTLSPVSGNFGSSMFMTSTKLYVGAYGDDNGANNSGSAYVYDLTDLSAAPTILSPSSTANDSVGWSVSATETHVVVSAHNDDTRTNNAGAVYVYEVSDLTGTPTKLVTPDGGNSDQFGRAVHIDSNNVYVGCRQHGTYNHGAVYVYSLSDLSAAPTKLEDGTNYLELGCDLASDDTNLYVGAMGYNDRRGAVFAYTLSDLSAAPTIITESELASNSYFGERVDARHGSLAIGAERKTENGTAYQGAVYVYDASDLSAAPTKLTAPDDGDTEFEYFGQDVSINEDNIVIGANMDDGRNGSAWVYDRNDLSAAPTKLGGNIGLAYDDRFGWAVASVSAQSALNGVTVTQSDNVFTVTPGQQGATFTLAFKATDSEGNVTSTTSDFTLDYVNQAPAVTGIDAAYTLTQGQDTVITAAATDPEGDTITWSFVETGGPTQSTVFNGSSYIKSDDVSSNLALGTSDFTVEAWVKRDSTTTNGFVQPIISTVGSTPAGDHSEWEMVINRSQGSLGWNTSSGAQGSTSYNSLVADQWVHVAVSRSGTTTRFFINGTYLDSFYDDYDYSASNVFGIGRRANNTTHDSFDGSIVDLRVVKGTALYTGNYSVPTGPLQNVAGTVLLTARSSSIIDESSVGHTFTSIGSITTSSDSPYPAGSNTGLLDTTVAQSDNVFTVTPGQQDATFQLTFKATDTAGNVTSVTSDFTLDYVNQAPAVSGIESAYTLTQGQDTVITAAATDAEGDAITWSFEEVQSDINSYVFSDRATAIDFALPSSLGDTWTIETWVKYGSGNGEHDGFFTTATVVPNSDPSNNGIATASYGWTPIPGDGSSPAGDDIEQWVTAGDYSGLPRDTWVHVAISSDGTTARTFVDGILITSTPTVNIGSDTISLGRRWTDIDGSYLFMGSLADFRVVKDTAIYTSNFSVPTEPLTEVPGTVLFTARASTITDSSSNSVSHTLLGSGVSASSDSPYPSSGDTGLLDTTVTQSDNVFTVTPGQQDATFTLAFKATDTAGNVTSVSSDFTLDYVNQAPAVSGIESSYLLSAGGSAEVITAAATDPEGDAITWSFVETGGSGAFDATSVSPIVHHTSAEMKAQFGDFGNMYFATFGDNGNKFYTVFVAGTGFPAGMQGTLRQFTLTTPYDITTATSEVTYDANSLSTIVGIDWSPDGTKAMVSFASTGTDSTKKQAAVLTVSTPWDISSVTSNVSNHDFLSSAYISGTTLKNTSNVIWGAKWADNGTKVLTTFRGVGVGLFGMNSEQPYQGTHPTSLHSEWLTTDSVISAEINESGTVLTYNIQGGTDEVLYRELSTPWDLSTVGAEQVLIPSSELTGATSSAVCYDENFEYLIVSDSDGDQYVFKANAASSLNGTTVTQSDNVFTVTPGSEATSFSIIFTATDVNGNATSTTSLFTVQESVMPSHSLLTGRKIIVGAAYDSEAGSNAGAAYVYQNNSFRKIVPPSSASNQYLTGQNQTMAFAVGLNRFVLATKDTSFNATAYVHNAFNDAIYHTYERSDFNADFTQSIAMSPEQSNPYIAFRLSGTDGNNARVSVVYSGSEQWFKVGPQNDNMFGDSMAMSNSHLFVGHRTRDVGGSNTGQITKYQLSNGSQKAQINGPSSNQQIGANLAVSTDRVVDGNFYDNSGVNSNYKGSVSIYDHNLNLITKIDSPLGNYSRFGSAIDVSGNRIVVGAEESPNVYVYDKNGNSVGTITGQSNHFGQYRGSIAVYGTDGNELIAIGEWLGDAEGSNYGDVYLYDGNLNLIGRLSGHDGGYFGSKVGIM